jgi:hypothetical protein
MKIKIVVTTFIAVMLTVALTSITYAHEPGWHLIKSKTNNLLCMGVKGTISEGANVQLYHCNDFSNVRLWWYVELDSICQFESGKKYCIDYRGGAVDAIITIKESWKGNQRWQYSSGDFKFHGNDNKCLDVEKQEVGGPGQVKITTCEGWKAYQEWLLH